ncbi:hypothetical protein [Providencia sp. SP181]|uniref:hypothetical protein n=1 Tax=Providencia sp. SP181 TaxID=3136277 RepID=UPI003D299B21
MNLLTHTVTKVLGDPIRKTFTYNGIETEYYLTQVECNCYGVISNTEVVTNTLKQAKAIKVGYEWEQ